MPKLADKTVFLIVLFLVLTSVGQEELEEGVKKPDFPELTTKDGRILRNAFVTAVEPDALLIRHEGGLARISLFELSPEI